MGHDAVSDRYALLGSGAELTLCFVDRSQFTTIVLYPGHRCELDAHGNYVIDID